LGQPRYPTSQVLRTPAKKSRLLRVPPGAGVGKESMTSHSVGSSALSQQQLEQLLQATLVPVEPNPQFFHRLRARMVYFQQHGPPGWVLVAAAGTILVLVGATFAVGLRMVLIAVGIAGLLTTRRKPR